MRIDPLLLTVILVAAMHCDGTRSPRVQAAKYAYMLQVGLRRGC
jgi:hypothetical protein